ncbi:MAG: OB-fold nucleic acid binding domain-containing protein, partial [Mariprofundaceae bacterium]|nr:OB-fold nucleic acid binding domain-containing protein [Mariprofundaceae bacterium]
MTTSQSNHTLPRTYCGNFRTSHLGQQVCLSGWVETNRDHGGVIFLDVRDRFGLIQVVAHPDTPEMHQLAHSMRQQDVIEVIGEVIARDDAVINRKLATGEVEIKIIELKVLNRAATPPFSIDDDCNAGEQHRLEYRYLDLRRPKMQKNLMLRHKVSHAARNYLDSQDFLDVETP